MMVRQATKRQLFVSVSLDEYVPGDHLLSAVDWGDPKQASRPVRDYLAALEPANPVPPMPKRISLTDPAPIWTAAAGAAIFAYSTNYLIGLKAGG